MVIRYYRKYDNNGTRMERIRLKKTDFKQIRPNLFNPFHPCPIVVVFHRWATRHECYAPTQFARIKRSTASQKVPPHCATFPTFAQNLPNLS